MRAAFLLAAFLVLHPALACAEAPATLPLCSKASKSMASKLPPGSELVLLVAAGNNIPSGEWPNYRKMALSTARCAGAGSTVTVRPITATSLTERRAFRELTPEPTGKNEGNPLELKRDWLAFDRRLVHALDTLPSLATPRRGSDGIAALRAAGNELGEASPVQRVIVMISNGWLQIPGSDQYFVGTRPERAATPLISKLRASNALPKLGGAHVIVVGLTSGQAPLPISSQQIEGLCAFWTAVVSASGGTMEHCQADLP